MLDIFPIDDLVSVYVVAPLFFVTTLYLFSRLTNKIAAADDKMPITLFSLYCFGFLTDLLTWTASFFSYFMFHVSNGILLFLDGLSWTCAPLKYVALALLLDYMIDQQFTQRWYQQLYVLIGMLVAISNVLHFFICHLLQCFPCCAPVLDLIHHTYLIFMCIVFVLLYLFRVCGHTFAPLFQREVRITMLVFLLPIIITETWPYTYMALLNHVPPYFGLISLVNLTLQTVMVYYFVRFIFGIRLINSYKN